MKKAIALFLVLIMCVTLFSCEKSSSSVQGSTQENAVPPEEFISIITDGECSCQIIYPYDSSAYIRQTVNALSDAVVDTFYCFVPKESDSVEYSSDTAEILIGKTNRPETEAALEMLEEGEYIIKVIGKKIVLVGQNEYLTNCAVNEFIEKYINTSGSSSLKLSSATEIIASPGVVTLGNTDATVRIMTFNVLGSGSDPQARIPYIVNAIETYDPCIIGFQECSKTQHNDMVSQLDGYSTAIKTHPGTSTAVYTPIVYKTEKFELVDAGVEWLDSRYTQTNTKSLAYAVFKDRQTDRVFAVINIHVALWVSNDYELPDGKTDADMTNEANNVWKPDNIRQMNDCMQDIYSEYGDIPVLWTGDFNFTENHSAYAKATTEYAMNDAEKTATVSKDDETKTLHSIGSSPSTGKSIDHIFGNSKIIFRIHKVCRAADDLKASDHCPVYADLLFK